MIELQLSIWSSIPHAIWTFSDIVYKQLMLTDVKSHYLNYNKHYTYVKLNQCIS